MSLITNNNKKGFDSIKKRSKFNVNHNEKMLEVLNFASIVNIICIIILSITTLVLCFVFSFIYLTVFLSLIPLFYAKWIIDMVKNYVLENIQNLQRIESINSDLCDECGRMSAKIYSLESKISKLVDEKQESIEK